MSNDGAMLTLTGLPTARGLVAGPVFVYRGEGRLAVPEYLVEVGSEDDELQRLVHARKDARRDLENLIAVLRQRTGRDDVRVFESHLLILDDPILVEASEGFIRRDRLNAEAAVRRTAEGARIQFERMNDPYFRERVRDLDDVERRILKALLGFASDPALELKSPAIVVADDLTPSETVRLPRECLLGFATNGGSTTSHVALLARSMGVPAVTGLVDVTSRVRAGETILLDGTAGTIVIRPDVETKKSFDAAVREQNEKGLSLESGQPAGRLKDGGDILICANVHPGMPLDGVRELGARGIGLYRSEYLWLNAEVEPSEEVQLEAYRAAAVGAQAFSSESMTTIRTLDIGGDKLVRGISQSQITPQREANPFLGNRSIRYLLSHPDVFRTQLRAILRASAFAKIRIMHPMVSCVEELQESARILDEVKRQLDAEGLSYDRTVPVGAMIEVPSAALNATALAECADFFSIGTNDLIQYTMAADRGNEAVAHLYQPLNPAILRLVEMTVSAAKEKGIPVGVCGESASDPIQGTLWVAMGVDSLSMSASYIPAIAHILARLTRDDLSDYRKTVRSVGPGATAAEILSVCRNWMSARVPEWENMV